MIYSSISFAILLHLLGTCDCNCVMYVLSNVMAKNALGLIANKIIRHDESVRFIIEKSLPAFLD